MAEIAKAEELPELLKAFDVNEGAGEQGAKLPSAMLSQNAGPLEHFVKMASQAIEGSAPAGTLLDTVVREFQKSFNTAASKAVEVPGSFLTFARMSYMPDAQANSNILPWPGVSPDTIRKIIMENLAPNLIIGMRVDDVVQYSQLSSHLWKPGWRFEVRQGNKTPSDEDNKSFREAEAFLQNSSSKHTSQDVINREEANLTNFTHFLVAITRDTLSYDGIAISTDRDNSGRIYQYAPVPAGNIRLVTQEGYADNKEVFAVAVDEGGSVKKTFTRKELIWYIRNPRTDPEYSLTMTRGYGTPEVQIALRLIQIFQNVIDFNAAIFNRSGVPHGQLLLTGAGWTQRQVDALTRLWHNLMRGISKALSLPVLAAPANGKIEVVDFSRIKGNEALYQDLLNLSIGCFCAVYRFPPSRLGYRISGKGPDNKRNPKETLGQLLDDDDPGRVALLTHIEELVNQYLIWPTWPTIKFGFTGKQPKADSREYEARKNAQTWAEARAEADLPALKAVAQGKAKELADIMALAPMDPNLAGIFQTLAASMLKPDAGGEGAQPGGSFTSKQDPAKSEQHGHVSGVRRDSAAETRLN